MQVCISIPSDIRLVVSTYDIDELIKNLQIPITVLSVFDPEDSDSLPAGCVRTMLTLQNPNVRPNSK